MSQNRKPSNDNHLRVLLVDDQLMIHEVLRRMLAEADEFELACCSEGVRAPDVAREFAPDVILQDLVMQDADGLELLRQYKADAALRDVPVIVLSGNDKADTKAQSFALGACDYLVKFPERVELLARLRHHANAHLALRQRNAAWEELKHIAITDRLTGLYNRWYFDEVYAREWLRARRERHPLALLLLDVDYFKRYNDYYGHQAGDVCLQKVARVLKDTCRRPGDFAARYGGEEFVVVLPDTALANAVQLAQLIRAGVAALEMPHAASAVAQVVTVSVGASCMLPRDESCAEELLREADRALYRAKAEGRNRVATPPVPDGA
ncbi:MAG: diguanylate cyclase [Zetaproteobacteria bacterium]|nr:MAG: diguanylate cyclase [Zetaproteobacteria bacterium]